MIVVTAPTTMAEPHPLTSPILAAGRLPMSTDVLP
jgi:hypothetical protein